MNFWIFKLPLLPARIREIPTGFAEAMSYFRVLLSLLSTLASLDC